VERLSAILAAIAVTGFLHAQTPKSTEPKLTSIDPFVIERGQTRGAVIRGTNLEGARLIWSAGTGVTGRVLRTEVSDKTMLVHAEIAVAATAASGEHTLRVVAANGLTNEVTLRVVDQPVAQEAESAGVLKHLPAIVNGRIGQHGESDEYCFEAPARQSFAFEVFSGGAGFDPVISLYEASGSWFDPKRRNLIDANDEPLNFPGRDGNARLVHQFAQAGSYCVRVEGFSGRGGPDAVYSLRVSQAAGAEPDLRPPPSKDWDERIMTRVLAKDWMARVAARGGAAAASSTPEIYRAAPDTAQEIPVMKVPGFIEGRIAKPGEAHLIRLNIEKAQKLTIEVETPKAAAPFFNPVVRLMEPGGTEMVTSVYTRLNNNNLKVFKAIQSKVTFDLQSPGVYTLQIRDLTTDFGGEDFEYRVLVRQQIPHVGRFSVTQERLNLAAGEARTLTLKADREEDFKGTLAFSVENLPAGVTAVTGLEDPDERPPLPNSGRMEHYRPKPQTASVLLAADAGAAPLEAPVPIRIVARLVVDGKLGEPIAVTEIPMMVVARRTS
jgi:hypothetical protein